jgi:hypothetical protein
MKMVELVEVVRENAGKSSYQMREFFQDMIDKKELEAFFVEVNKKTVEKDTEDEKVIRTKKGATLTLIRKLKEYEPTLVKDPITGIMYNLDIGSRGGMFFDDGDSQTMYHHCTLERLIEQFDPKKIGTRKGFSDFGSFDDGIQITREMVIARLRVSYDEDREYSHIKGSDYIAKTRGHLVVEGMQDKLFERVCRFVRAEKHNR